MASTHDGSLASKCEAWIVTQIEALAAFEDADVEVFQGTTQPDGRELVGELTSKRSPYAVVLFEGDQPRPLEEGEQAYEPTYAVYIVVQNKRPGTARTGEVVGADTIPGTNGLRDLLRNALHDKSPAQSANGFYAERSEFRGVRIVFQRTDVFIMRAVVVIHEGPAAA